MIAEGIRLEGFAPHHWERLVGLLSDGEWLAATLVLFEEEGQVVAAMAPGDTALTRGTPHPADDLDGVCEQYGTTRAMVVRLPGAAQRVDRLLEGLAEGEPMATQWVRLALASMALGVERGLRLWPEVANLPIPAPQVLARSLDTVLPSGRTLLVALWEGESLWTALCLRRRSDGIDLAAGPEAIAAWTGPMGGDYRRDHRAMERAVARHVGPVHLGLFAQREDLMRLLRDPRPGAWARAVATRELLVEPAPLYVTVAMGADAGRAAAQYAGERLGGIDLWGLVQPFAQVARERVARVASVTQLLGFNPLQALAQRLRGIEPEQPIEPSEAD